MKCNNGGIKEHNSPINICKELIEGGVLGENSHDEVKENEAYNDNLRRILREFEFKSLL